MTFTLKKNRIEKANKTAICLHEQKVHEQFQRLCQEHLLARMCQFQMMLNAVQKGKEPFLDQTDILINAKTDLSSTCKIDSDKNNITKRDQTIQFTPPA